MDTVAQMSVNLAEDYRRRRRRIQKSSVAPSARGKMVSCAAEMFAAVATEAGAETG